MSAFIVSTETMQRVIAAITDNGSIYEGIFGGEHLLGGCTDLDKLGAALFEMNKEAVIARYREPVPAVPVFSYRPLGVIPKEDRFMAVQCLIYQCSEGDVPERQLYRDLAKIGKKLANEIAYEVARAAKCPWDYPERGAVVYA